jgi:hypothetical protein
MMPLPKSIGRARFRFNILAEGANLLGIRAIGDQTVLQNAASITMVAYRDATGTASRRSYLNTPIFAGRQDTLPSKVSGRFDTACRRSCRRHPSTCVGDGARRRLLHALFDATE